MGIKWSDLNKWSLVDVEFGEHESRYQSTTHGLNIGSEFCYRHMAIVVSNDVLADEIAVVPLTSYKHSDENYPTNVIIDVDRFAHMVTNKTTIKVRHIRSIDKKKRIKRIIKPFISKTLQLKIEEAIRRSF